MFGLVAEQCYKEHHPKLVKSVVAVVNADEIDEDQFWISKKWLTDWQRDSPRMHQKGSLTDPNPGQAEFGADVVCPHGLLQPDFKRRTLISQQVSYTLSPAPSLLLTPFVYQLQACELLETIFPGWEHSTLSVPCEECTAAGDQDLVRAHEEHDIKTIERGPLKALLDFSQPKLVGLVLFMGMDQFIVPRDWVRQWAAWAKDMHLTSKKPRPGKLDNSAFLCEHGRVMIDVEAEVKAPKEIALVCEKGWDCLRAK